MGNCIETIDEDKGISTRASMMQATSADIESISDGALIASAMD